MGNPRASSNLAPGTTLGPLSFREGTLFISGRKEAAALKVAACAWGG